MSKIKGPGYINRETRRDTSRAFKKEKMVCPAEKERMMQEGYTKSPYFMGGKNCHSWANGCSK